MLQRIKNSEFLRHVFVLLSGTALAQLIPFFLSPVLSRLYSPESFGTYALFLTLTNLVAIVATARYELAVVLPSADDKAHAVVKLCGLIIAGIFLTVMIPVFFFNGGITALLKNPAISPWLYLVPFNVLILGVFQTMNYWYNRQKKYHVLAVNKILRNTGTGIVHVTGGVFHAGAVGLIAGQLFGDLLAAVSMLRGYLRENFSILRKISFSSVKEVAVEYRQFPLYNSIQVFFDQARDSSISFIITSSFSGHVLGLYYFGLRLVQAPLTLLSFSFSQVLYQKMSFHRSSRLPLMQVVMPILKNFFLLSVIVIVFILFFLKDIFGFLFGTAWVESAEYVTYMIPYFAVNFIVSSLSSVPLVFMKQQFNMVWSVVNNLILIAMVYMFAQYHDFKMMLLAFSGTAFLIYIAVLGWYLYIIKQHDASL